MVSGKLPPRKIATQLGLGFGLDLGLGLGLGSQFSLEAIVLEPFLIYKLIFKLSRLYVKCIN